MRIGSNPNRNKIESSTDFFHHVVLPVYVPDAQGYFADGFEILRYSIESLLLTSHVKTYITVVDNGSSEQVRSYLHELLSERKINELITTSNIGKMNAVFKGIFGHGFDFVTIVDSDVMFLNGWQQATYEVFWHFPKAGAVCPTPSSKSYRSYGSAILGTHFFSRNLRFTPVKNREGLIAFAHSVNNPDFYNKFHLEQFLTIANGNFRAVVGAGHFFVTYKAAIFDKPVARYTNNKLGAERDLIDLPVIRRGLWRLSTEDNYAYHLGNVAEEWMAEKFSRLVRTDDAPSMPDATIPPVTLWDRFIEWISSIFFRRKRLVRWFLRHKGLSREASLKY